MHYLIILCFGILSISAGVFADSEPEPKRGEYPFLGFIYYFDETILDASGARFFRSAVLIKPDWLVTSAIADGPGLFPEKTLLARLGAINIDANFTYNQDEDEQELEVIQIVRPYNHSRTQWWITDISLIKTLLSFTKSSVVSPVSLNLKHQYTEKNCVALIFLRKRTTSEERVLMQAFVELLPPSITNCGTYFHQRTMTCAADIEDKKTALDKNFCQGNSGGPLICENEIIAIQTYIDNDCKSPHLYQLLSVWKDLISCTTQDACSNEICSHTCDIIVKDTPEKVTEEMTLSTTVATADITTSTPSITITTASTNIVDTTKNEITEVAEEVTTEIGRSEVVTESGPREVTTESGLSEMATEGHLREITTEGHLSEVTTESAQSEVTTAETIAVRGNIIEVKSAPLSDDEDQPPHSHPTRISHYEGTERTSSETEETERTSVEPEETERTSLETEEVISRRANSEEDDITTNTMMTPTRSEMHVKHRLKSIKSYSARNDPTSYVFSLSFLILSQML